MRRWFVAILVLGLLAACTSESSETTTSGLPDTVASTTRAPTTATAPPGPSHGGEARIPGWVADDSSFNPYVDHWPWIFDEAYTVGALRPDYTTGATVPYVVREVPSIDNGGLVDNGDGTLTVTYHIRPEAVWADGVPISGNDFRFTAELLKSLDPEEAFRSEAYDWIVDGSLVTDAKSFAVTLDRLTPLWEDLFVYLLPAHDVEGKDFFSDFDEAPWVSGGPFIVESKGEETVTLVRNPRYWEVDQATGARLPYLDRIVMGEFPVGIEAILELLPEELHDDAILYDEGEWLEVCSQDPDPCPQIEAAFFDAEIQSFLDGDFHAFGLFILIEPYERGSVVDEVLANSGIGGGRMVGNGIEHLGFSFGPGRLATNPDSWNEHLRFRQAVAHAIDRAAILEAIWGESIPVANSMLDLLSPTLSGGPWSTYNYDPEYARALLDELCADLDHDCANDRPIVHFSAPFAIERGAFGDLLTEYLDEVGIDVVWEATGEITSGFDTIAIKWFVGIGGANLAYILNWFDPEAAPFDPFAGTGANPYHWCTDDSVVSGPQCDRYAEIIDEFSMTIDPEETSDLAQEAQQILADDLVVIPLYVHPAFAVWREDLLGGFGQTYQSNSWFWNCAHWYVPES